MKSVRLFFWSLILFSCNSASKTTAPKDSVVYSSSNISEARSTINPNPVKTYHETIKSFETTDEFKVSLFETNQTFKYVLKINYKQLDAEDTLYIPNVGKAPQPQIIKGEKRPSCIIGFLDNAGQFKELKLVYFEDNMLKVHVLKSYSVAPK